MIGRRGFLSLLGAAPVAAPAAVQEAVSGMALGNATGIGSVKDAVVREEVALQRALGSFQRKNERFYGPIPADIASKKSWSPAFKESEARKREVTDRVLHGALTDIVYSDDQLPVRLAKIAKLGVKL